METKIIYTYILYFLRSSSCTNLYKYFSNVISSKIICLYTFIKFLLKKEKNASKKGKSVFTTIHTLSDFFIRMFLFGKLYRLFTKPLHSDFISDHYILAMIIKTDSYYGGIISSV